MDRRGTIYALFLLIGVVCANDRTLQSELNPGCDCCNKNNITLMYIKLVGENDILHNIWDFTGGKPTIIFAITNASVTLNIEWNTTTLTPTKLTFSETPKYSFGIVIDKLWEFNDVNDTGIFDRNSTQKRMFDMTYMNWQRSNLIMYEDQVMIEVVSHSFGKQNRKGNVMIKIDLYPYTAYAFDLPHLVHSANSSLIDIVLENMTITQNFNQSRFAIEMMAISTEKVNKSIILNVRKGLDDEHTPGVFEIVELITPESYTSGNGGFLQYRPVSYIHQLRDVASSTKANTGELSFTNITANTIAYNYFYNNLNESMHILSESFIVSIGNKGDSFYNKTNYNIWSFTAGYGRPPGEGFSLLVILILSIGLGIPVLLIITGGVYICIKRHRNSRNNHNILVEE